MKVENAYILTDKIALHLQALQTFTDVLGTHHRAGEEWLVTIASVDTYIPSVNERVVGEVKITTLNLNQYCVIINPVIVSHPPGISPYISPSPHTLLLLPFSCPPLVCGQRWQ